METLQPLPLSSASVARPAAAHTFYRRWVVANGWSESVGLGTTFVIGLSVASANAVAWAVGMPLIFAGMDLVPWGGHPIAVMLAIYLVCAAAGLVVAAMHGAVLVRLLDAPDAGRNAGDGRLTVPPPAVFERGAERRERAG